MSHVEEKEKNMGGEIEPESPFLLVMVGFDQVLDNDWQIQKEEDYNCCKDELNQNNNNSNKLNLCVINNNTCCQNFRRETFLEKETHMKNTFELQVSAGALCLIFFTILIRFQDVSCFFVIYILVIFFAASFYGNFVLRSSLRASF